MEDEITTDIRVLHKIAIYLGVGMKEFVSMKNVIDKRVRLVMGKCKCCI